MSSSADTWCVIVAAGRSERFGGDVPKQFTPLAGKPMAQWSVERFAGHPSIAGVTVVVPENLVDAPPEWLLRFKERRVRIAPGGATRTESVRSGLECIENSDRPVSLVAVHDAARPLVSDAIISAAIQKAREGRGAVVGRRVTDTLKCAEGDEALVVRTIDRSNLWRAETPQVFELRQLREVYERAVRDGVHGTDSAGLCERYGIPVALVEVSEPNMKLTHPADVEFIECVLKGRDKDPGQG